MSSEIISEKDSYPVGLHSEGKVEGNQGGDAPPPFFVFNPISPTDSSRPL